MLLLRTERLPEGTNWLYVPKPRRLRADRGKSGRLGASEVEERKGLRQEVSEHCAGLADLPDNTAVDAAIFTLGCKTIAPRMR